MTWWKRRRCRCCDAKIHKREKTATICVEATDGTLEMLVCEECARFWEMSHRVLNERKDDEPL